MKNEIIEMVQSLSHIRNIKEVYQRPDGALKIRYYNDSDALQIVDIDD
mgnify:CR=1 FL=1